MFDTSKTYRLSIRDQLRMANVERWQIMKTDRQQNVAEHTCNVMLIAMDILDRWEQHPDLAMDILDRWEQHPDLPLGRLGDLGNIRSGVLMACLYHDLPEVVLGDLPSPLKDAMGPAASQELKNIEQSFEPSYPAAGIQASILKAADLMDAIHFLRQQGQDEHAMNVKVHLGHKLEAVIQATEDHPLRDAMESTYAKIANGKQTFLEDLI